ncbi:hypothetical protein HYH03_009151 [Edaphochlamys debaryana]|uniref:PAS domain-containing protein n=1 Tax=Edaphochlamys debaryana TaxID=47281 RepID=A0A835Y1R2_9CHLO|nr:hypothetical protein HYH03_009151 [Edaphochlamys debaryana]|eukprot:KAG2492486.1 hypothetical protein HYH03_009151 [Edaphochlamys debaryana]
MPAASIASSVSGMSAAPELPKIRDDKTKDGKDGEDGGEIVQRTGLEGAVFGVLFTLSQEKNTQQIFYHWIIIKILLDAWQLFVQILTPEYGWDINPQGTWWRCLSVLSFGWLGDIGYGLYVGLLYAVAALLALNIALCVWVAVSFKQQKFDYVWPIKMVRGFSYVFIQVFDVTSLNFLQLGISCNYTGDAGPRLHMAIFPSYSCSAMPQLAQCIVSGILLGVFVLVAMLVNLSEVEVNPASRSPQALGHSGAEVWSFFIKFLMTLVSTFLGWPKVAAGAYLALTLWLAWCYLRWVPHLVGWVNDLKGGVAVAMVFVAGLQVAVVFCAPSLGHTLTNVLAVGLGPAFAAGVLATYLRRRLFAWAVLRAFRTTDTEKIKPQDVYGFLDPRDVEVAARCARVWADRYTLDKAAVGRAQDIIKAGLARFPQSAFAGLVHADFLLDVLGFSQTGGKQLEAARKLDPSLLCRFMLFVRRQQATQKAASSTVGKGGSMDLLGYVEYQRKQRMVLRHHKEALQAMASFWRILGYSSNVSFRSLSKSLEEIDTSVKQAEAAYRAVLEMYGNSPRLVRLYARFLATIKQDPWGAAEYSALADRIETNKDSDGDGPALPDGTPIGRIDEVDKGVLVVNAFGDIQVVNKKLMAMFGYRKGELDGKNVTLLMPPHDAKRHPGLLRRYIDSGKEAAPMFRQPVLGIHRERVAFPVQLAISRASGMGEDSVFIGLLEPTPTEPGVGRLWATADGVVVCCDAGFVTCFGLYPSDVIGTQLHSLLKPAAGEAGAAEADGWAASRALSDSQKLVQRLVDKAQAVSADGSATPSTTGSRCFVRHKYDAAREVTMSVGIDKSRSIFEFRMQLLSDEPQLLMVVEKRGAIRHMSGDLSKLLGVASSDIRADDQVMLELNSDSAQRSLDDFLPAPWKHLHAKILAGVPKGSAPQALLSGIWGCRPDDATPGGAGGGLAALGPLAGGAGTAGSAPVPGSAPLRPTMRLVGQGGQPVYVRVAVNTREEGGDSVYVVRMARSSLETAVAERCIRVRLSESGTVQEGPEEEGGKEGMLKLEGSRPATAASRPTTASAEAAANAAADKAAAVDSLGAQLESLFGFTSKELVGCRLWDFVTLQANPEADLGPLDGAEQGGRASATSLGVGPRLRLAPPPVVAAPAAAAVAATTSPRAGAALRSPAGLDGPGATSTKRAASHAQILTSGGGDLLDEAASAVFGVGGADLDEDALPLQAQAGPAGALPLPVMPEAEGHATLTLGPGPVAEGLEAEAFAQPPSGGLPGGAFNMRTFDAMVTCALETPGISWRVTVVPPTAAAEAAAMGNEARAAAHIASLTRAAVLRLDVVVPRGRARPPGMTPGSLLIHAELWAAQGLTGVVELDARGRITSLAEEQVRPAGLLFGVPSPRLLGADLAALLRLPPGASLPSLHAESAKKSALKAAAPGVSKEADTVKVGPVHLLPALHRDGRQLPLTLQLVGKPAPGSPLTAILRLAPVEGIDAAAVAAALAAGRQAAASTDSPMPTFASTTRRASQLVTELSAMRGPGSPVPGGPSRTASGVPSPGPGGLSRLGRQAGAAAPNSPGAPLRLRSSVEGPAPGGPLSPGGGGWRDTLARAMSNSGDGAAPPAGPGAPSPLGPGGRRASIVLTADGAAAPAASAGGSKPGSGGSGGAAGLEGAVGAAGEGPGSGSGSGGEGSGRPHVRGGPLVVDSAAEVEALPLDSPRSRAGLPGAVEGGKGEEEGEGVQAAGAGADPAKSRKGTPPAGARAKIETADGGKPKSPTKGPALAKAPSNKIQKWVTSGGEYYQNSVRAGPEAVEESSEEEGDSSEGSSGAGAGDDGWRSPHGSEEGNGGKSSRAASPSKSAKRGWAAEGEQGGQGHEVEAEEGRARPRKKSDDGNGSDGGESAVSGTSGLSDGDTGDFKRGKKLTHFKLLVAATIFVCMAVHVLCFALIMDAIHWQNDALATLTDMGDGQAYLQKCVVYLRAMDQAYRGKGSNVTYGPADADHFANEMFLYLNLYNDMNNRILERSRHQSITLLFYSEKLTVWTGYNSTTGEDTYATVTSWDLLTRLLIAALNVYQTHQEWAAEGIYPTDTNDGMFVLRSAQALADGSDVVWLALQEHAEGHTANVNTLQLIFLVIEGFLVSSCTAVCLIYLLRMVSESRYKLYETFLSIPIGLTRALASQTTHLLDADESDDDDDEEVAAATKGAEERAEGSDGEGGTAHPRRRANFDEGGADVESAAGGGGRRGGEGEGKGGKKGKKDGKKHGGSGAQGDPSQSHRKGSSSHQRGSASEAGGAKDAAGGAEDGGYGPLRLLKSGSLAAPRQSGGFLASLKARFSRRNSVSPAPGAKGDKEVRALKRNSRVFIAMLAIAVTYSLLIIIFYSIGYILTMTTQEEVAMVAMAQRNTERVCKGVFYAQELCAEESLARVAARVAAVRLISVQLKDAYYTLRMGIDAWRVAGPNVEQFPGVVNEGIAKASPAMFQLFFGTGDCQRIESAPCPDDNYRYYQVTHGGVEAILFKMLLSLGALGDAAEGAAAAVASGNSTQLLGLESVDWDYIYNAGLNDLADGIVRIGNLEKATVNDNFSTVVIMHVVLFILLVVVFAVFVFALLVPMLRRMKKEKRRITEMLSQLPTELDVMKLVAVALLGSAGGAKAAAEADPRRSGAGAMRRSSTLNLGGPGGVPGNAVAPLPSSGSVVVPMDGGAPEGDSKAWKDILKQTASLRGSNAGATSMNSPVKRA